ILCDRTDNVRRAISIGYWQWLVEFSNVNFLFHHKFSINACGGATTIQKSWGGKCLSSVQGLKDDVDIQLTFLFMRNFDIRCWNENCLWQWYQKGCFSWPLNIICIFCIFCTFQLMNRI